MASTEIEAFAVASQPNSALALVAPSELVPLVQPIRSLYDQAAVKWPPHMNIFYPFVSQSALNAAADVVDHLLDDFQGIPVSFDRAEAWKTGPHYTIVLRPNEETEKAFEGLYQLLTEKFSQIANTKKHKNGAYKMHMTLGQMSSQHMADAFASKVEKLCSMLGQKTWFLGSMSRINGRMQIQKTWGGALNMDMSLSDVATPGYFSSQGSYTYQIDTLDWKLVSETDQNMDIPIKNFTVSTYNCMFSPESPNKDEVSRYHRLVNNILQASATIVCLQEVSDALLTFLLSNAKTRKLYKFVSHNPSEPLLYMQNCVILSSLPFSVQKLVIDSKRSATFAIFNRVHREGLETTIKPLIVVSVHLPAHLTDDAVSKKLDYCGLVQNHIEKHFDQDLCIVAGDFNLASEENQKRALEDGHVTDKTLDQLETVFSEKAFIDTWSLTTNSLDQHDGNTFTFDPFTNELAMNNVLKFSKLPPSRHRYDRILIRKQGSDGVLIRDTKLFGQPTSNNERPASDHWGLLAYLRAGEHSIDPDQAPLPLPDITSQDEVIEEALISRKLVPTVGDKQERLHALQILKQCLGGNVGNEVQEQARSGALKMELVAVGSFGLGTWNQDSDMDCLAVGNITMKTFWKFAREKVKKWQGKESIKVVRFVNATIPMLILLVNDKIRIDLQYCTAVHLVEIWPTVSTLSPNDPLFNLPVTTLKKLQAYRDMHHLVSTLPNLPKFRLAYRFIKQWAVNRGIYSSKFGYIGGIHITLLLSRVCLLLPPSATVTQIIKAFYGQYAGWNWATDSVWQPNLPKKIRYQRSIREKMVILTINAPAVNVAFNATKHTVEVLSQELNMVNQLINENQDWVTACLDKSAEEYFVSSFARYVKIDVQFWGNNKQKGRALAGWVESRCVMLLSDLANKVPSLSARIWPKRFHEVPSSGEIDNEAQIRELRGFYLVGISSVSESLSKDEKRRIDGIFRDTLQTFEDAIKSSYDGKFDETDSWIQVRCVKPDQLCEQPNHKICQDDTGIWDGGVGEDGESDDEDDMSEEEEDNDAISAQVNAQVSNAIKTSRGKNQETPKLRPSNEVLARIRWDSTYDASDYVIGYEDRFRGIIEMEVVNWKTDNTHDEFVPMHRVVHFRRKSDNVKVWDRASKTDKVFGSGTLSEGK